MKRINAHQLGIEQGSILLFSDFQDGGEMWAGQGPRVIRRDILFDEPFASPPTVAVGLSMLDMDHETNHRVDVSSEQITEKGFAIVFRTWGDTRVARVRTDWMAIGAVRHADDWDV